MNVGGVAADAVSILDALTPVVKVVGHAAGAIGDAAGAVGETVGTVAGAIGDAVSSLRPRPLAPTEATISGSRRGATGCAEQARSAEHAYCGRRAARHCW